MAGESPINIIAGQIQPKLRDVMLSGAGKPKKPELSTTFRKKMDEIDKVDQETNSEAWKVLYEPVEDLPDISNDCLQAKDKFSYDSHLEKMQQLKTGNFLEDADIIDAEKRSIKAGDGESVLNDIKRYSSLDGNRQDEVAKFLVDEWKNTNIGRQVLQENPKINPDQIKDIVKEMLADGLHSEDIQGLHKDLEQWISSANRSLDPLNTQIKVVEEGLNQVIKEHTQIQTEIDKLTKEITEKETEQKKYTTSGTTEFDKIENLESNEGERKILIESLPDDIHNLEMRLERFRNKLEAVIARTGSAPLGGLDITKLAELASEAIKTFAQKGQSVNISLPQGAGGAKPPDIDFSSFEDQITNLSKEIRKKQKELGKAETDQQSLERLRKERDGFPKTIKDLKEKKTEKEKELAEKSELIKVGKTQLAETLKKFSSYEERLANSVSTEIVHRLLARNINRRVEKTTHLLEKAMTAVSEERKLKLRQLMTKRYMLVEGTVGERLKRALAQGVGTIFAGNIDAQGNVSSRMWMDISNWIDNRIRGKDLTVRWNENLVNKDFQDRLLRPDENFANVDDIIKQAYGTTEWKEISRSPIELQQLRAQYALELNAFRYYSVGEMPTILEQRILISQPWSNELIKAGVIGNPEFVEQMQENVPDVTPDAIKNNDAAALGKVREAATTNRVMGLVLLGLSATSAASAFTKEEKQQPA